MIDVVDRLADAVDDAHRQDRVEIFGAPVLLGRRHRRRIDRQDRRIAAQFAAGRAQIGEDRRQRRLGDFAVDQQCFGRAADRHPAHLGVEHDPPRLFRIGRAVDIGVAQPFEMGDHRNPALALHALDQRGTAAWHDDVDHPAHLQHHADRVAVAGRDQLDGIFGQASRTQPVLQGCD